MIKKIDNLFSKLKRRNIILLLSFLLPLTFMLVIFIMKGIFPFGNRSFLRTDLYHQYAPFYSELIYKIKNFKSLLYTHDVGIGTNFISLFAYYLSSPFNILLFFVDEKYIIEFITYAVVLKIALCGLTMAIYLINRYKCEKLFVVFFALFYAMSGYIAAYSWNIMWLDCVWMFPLLILGFERAFYNDNSFLYIVVLGMSILTNYYIAAMECFFLIFYFVILLFLSNTKKVKNIINKLIRIILYSSIGVMLSAILLIPTIYAFTMTGSNKFEFPKSGSEYFSIMDIIARHMPYVEIENGLDHWPNIYCGVFIIVLLILYFYNKKISLREKIVYSVVLIFFYASFSINFLNFFWHVFKYPNSLPARQSFIYIFLLLIVGFRSLNKIKNVDKKNIDKSFVISLSIVILLNAIVVNDKIGFHNYYLGMIYILIYYLLLKMYIKNKKNLFFIAVAIISVELVTNMYVTSVTTINRNEYIEDYEDIRNLTEDVYSMNDDFYRLERMEMTAKDDGAFYNFRSPSIFSSTAYRDGTEFYKKVGCEASFNAYSITGSTPFIDALLDVKYAFYKNELENPRDLNLRFIDKSNDINLYQRLDTLPLSFVLSEQFINDYDYSSANPATVQNNFARTMNLSPMLDKIDVNIDGKKANFIVEDSGDYYVFVRDKSIKEVSIHYPNTTKTFKNLDRGFFIELGYLKAKEEFELVNNTNDKDLLIEVFRFSFENLKAVIDKINENSKSSINNFSDTRIKYDLISNIDGMCFISIPYDESWEIKVDGETVDLEKVFDFFLGFKIDKGNHKIEMSYMPRGFLMGFLVSLIGVICLVFLFIIKKKYPLKIKGS